MMMMMMMMMIIIKIIIIAILRENVDAKQRLMLRHIVTSCDCEAIHCKNI